MRKKHKKDECSKCGKKIKMTLRCNFTEARVKGCDCTSDFDVLFDGGKRNEKEIDLSFMNEDEDESN